MASRTTKLAMRNAKTSPARVTSTITRVICWIVASTSLSGSPMMTLSPLSSWAAAMRYEPSAEPRSTVRGVWSDGTVSNGSGLIATCCGPSGWSVDCVVGRFDRITGVNSRPPLELRTAPSVPVGWPGVCTTSCAWGIVGPPPFLARSTACPAAS